MCFPFKYSLKYNVLDLGIRHSWVYGENLFMLFSYSLAKVKTSFSTVAFCLTQTPWLKFNPLRPIREHCKLCHTHHPPYNIANFSILFLHRSPTKPPLTAAAENEHETHTRFSTIPFYTCGWVLVNGLNYIEIEKGCG